MARDIMQPRENWFYNQGTGVHIQHTPQAAKELIGQKREFDERKPSKKQGANRLVNARQYWEQHPGPSERVHAEMPDVWIFNSVALREQFLEELGRVTAPVVSAPVIKTANTSKSFEEMTRPMMVANLSKRFPDKLNEIKDLRTKSALIEWEANQEGAAE